MKKLLLSACLLFALNTVLHAQAYQSGIGARLGFPAGLSYKQFTNRTLAIEGILGVNGIGSPKFSYSLTLLAENHNEILIENLFVLYGLGGHLGSYDSKFEFGIDGIVGLEYVFRNAPIAFSFDFKPNLSIISNVAFKSGGAFTLRYVF